MDRNNAYEQVGRLHQRGQCDELGLLAEPPGIGDTDVQLCPLSRTPAHPRARPFIGHSLDTDRKMYAKSLKSLELPRGSEPMFQP